MRNDRFETEKTRRDSPLHPCRRTRRGAQANTHTPRALSSAEGEAAGTAAPFSTQAWLNSHCHKGQDCEDRGFADVEQTLGTASHDYQLRRGKEEVVGGIVNLGYILNSTLIPTAVRSRLFCRV